MTAGFNGFLDLRQLSRRRWLTIRPFTYTSAVADRTIVIPAEFVTDLASVPRLPVAYLVAGGRANGPAVVHDWLYQHPEWADRAVADRVFLEAMGCHQPEWGHEAEHPITRRLMWGAVRAGGWWAWNRHRGPKLNPEWTADVWPSVVEAP